MRTDMNSYIFVNVINGYLYANIIAVNKCYFDDIGKIKFILLRLVDNANQNIFKTLLLLHTL